MKRTILLLLLACSSQAFSQQQAYDYKPAVPLVPQEIAVKLGFADYKPDAEATEPEFPGGNHKFRMAIANNFDNSAVSGTSGRLVTFLYLVVEKDGTISNVLASGANGDFNAEAERTVRMIKSPWIPAKVGKEPVRYICTFPLTMTFE